MKKIAVYESWKDERKHFTKNEIKDIYNIDGEFDYYCDYIESRRFNEDRQQLNILKEEIEKGHISKVIVKEAIHISRNTMQILNFIMFVHENNCEIQDSYGNDYSYLYDFAAQIKESIKKEERRFKEKYFEKAYFCFDCEPYYEGYHVKRMRWNGWAMPYFTKEEADKIAKDMNDNGGIVKYDEKNKMYKVIIEQYIDEDNPEQDESEYTEIFKAELITIDGKEMELYPFGAGYYTWDDYTKEEIEEMQLSSDENSKEYKYITSHGIGPGSCPSDAYIRSEELPNYTVLYVNRLLTEEELNYYDIKKSDKLINSTKENDDMEI